MEARMKVPQQAASPAINAFLRLRRFRSSFSASLKGSIRGSTDPDVEPIGVELRLIYRKNYVLNIEQKKSLIKMMHK
jgi:hypothetical protein